MLDCHDHFGQEAQLEYLDANIRVVRPGKFVRCAVTGDPIPLEKLRYWSVERQEAYAHPQAVLQRLGLAESDEAGSGDRK